MLDRDALERQIEDRMQAGRVPGLALAIVHGQDVIYAKGFGTTSVEDGGVPVTPHTLFRIASTTKSLTGTMIMRLVDAGLLDLDRPITAYLPWFRLSEDGAAECVTLRMLLSHTSGLPSDVNDFGSRDPGGLEARVRYEIPQYPLLAPPGKVFSYSNPGLDVAGYVAEAASGAYFADLMTAEVFSPLHMSRTTFDLTVAMTYPLAQAHDLHPDGTLSVQHRFADNTGEYPDGFALSTAADMANFAIMHMNGGCFHDSRILSASSVAEMQTMQAPFYTPDRSGYGLTFFLESYKGTRRVQHGGGMNSFYTKFVMAPEQRIAVVALYNRAGASVEKIVNRIFDQLLDLPRTPAEPRMAAPDRSLWPRFAGTYVGKGCGLATIRADEEQLILEWNGDTTPLEALAPDLYVGRIGGGKEVIPVGFLPEAEGPTHYILINRGLCKRLSDGTHFRADPLDWSRYVGTYSRGTGPSQRVLTVEIAGEQLVVSSSKVASVTCIPLDKTLFACKLGLLQFHTADDGVASMLKLGSFTYARISDPPSTPSGTHARGAPERLFIDG